MNIFVSACGAILHLRRLRGWGDNSASRVPSNPRLDLRPSLRLGGEDSSPLWRKLTSHVWSVLSMGLQDLSRVAEGKQQ